MYLPLAHVDAVHDVLPVWLWYFPSSHVAHVAPATLAAPAAANVPAAQLVPLQVAWPAWLVYWPGGHFVQDVVPYLPCAQVTAAL